MPKNFFYEIIKLLNPSSIAIRFLKIIFDYRLYTVQLRVESSKSVERSRKAATSLGQQSLHGENSLGNAWDFPGEKNLQSAKKSLSLWLCGQGLTEKYVIKIFPKLLFNCGRKIIKKQFSKFLIGQPQWLYKVGNVFKQLKTCEWPILCPLRNFAAEVRCENTY